MGFFACCDGEGLREAETDFFVFVDVDACSEGLVREPLPVGVGALVEQLAVDQEPERLRDLAPRSLVLIVFVLDATVNVGEPRSTRGQRTWVTATA